MFLYVDIWNTCGTVTFCINKTDIQKEIFMSRYIEECTNQRVHQWYVDSESFLDDFSGHSKFDLWYIMQKWTRRINMTCISMQYSVLADIKITEKK